VRGVELSGEGGSLKTRLCCGIIIKRNVWDKVFVWSES